MLANGRAGFGYVTTRCLSHAIVQGWRPHRRTSSSPYYGVTRSKQKWLARLNISGTAVYVGTFACEIAAACAVDEARRSAKPDQWLERLNFPSASERRLCPSLHIPTLEHVAVDRLGAASSKYNGVSWAKACQKWRARLCHLGVHFFLGYFDDERHAALAYDAALSRIQQGNPRLNFPEHSDKKRILDILRYGHAHLTEARAFLLLSRSLSNQYEIHRLGEGTHADAIFRRSGPVPVDEWVGIQIKSTKGLDSPFYFTAIGKYTGLLLVLIAVERKIVRTVPGDDVNINTFRITEGGQRDCVYRCLDLTASLASAWEDKCRYKRQSRACWELPKNQMCQIERRGQALGRKWFNSFGLAVDRPFAEHGHYDVILDGSIRAQEKTGELRELPIHAQEKWGWEN